jgi:hypothetical protein
MADPANPFDDLAQAAIQENRQRNSAILADLSQQLGAAIAGLAGDDELKQAAKDLQSQVDDLSQMSADATKSKANIDASASALKSDLQQFEARFGGAGEAVGKMIRTKLTGFFPAFP